MKGRSPEPRYWMVPIVFVASFGWAFLLAWLLTGCLKLVAPSGSTKVDITKIPMPAAPYCELPGFPSPPPELQLDHRLEDVIDRTMVHIRDYNLIIEWGMYVSFWSQRVQECLDRLTNKPAVHSAPPTTKP